MPTYSYKCTECGNAFDIHQAFTDDTLTTCPECGGRLRKVFSPVGVTFNGSGFYRTDSRADASKRESGASKKEKTQQRDSGSSGSSGDSSSSSSGSKSGSTSSGSSSGGSPSGGSSGSTTSGGSGSSSGSKSA